MMYLFRRTTALYWFLCISALIGVSYLDSILSGNPIRFILIPISIILAYMSYRVSILCDLMLEKKYRVLLENCYTEEYIEFYKKRLKRKCSPGIRYHALICLCRGYLLSGKNEEGKCTLDKITMLPKTGVGDSRSILYYYYLSLYYLRVNDLDKAEDAFKKMKFALANPKISKKYNKYFAESYYFINITLNIYKGKYVGAEEYYYNNFEKAKSLLEKVFLKYYLGVLYSRSGDIDKALAAYEFVLDNGNDTYYAKTASEYLTNSI